MFWGTTTEHRSPDRCCVYSFFVSEKEKGADPVEDTVPKVNGDGLDLSMAGTPKGSVDNGLAVKGDPEDTSDT